MGSAACMMHMHVRVCLCVYAYLSVVEVDDHGLGWLHVPCDTRNDAAQEARHDNGLVTHLSRGQARVRVRVRVRVRMRVVVRVRCAMCDMRCAMCDVRAVAHQHSGRRSVASLLPHGKPMGEETVGEMYTGPPRGNPNDVDCAAECRVVARGNHRNGLVLAGKARL